MVKILSKDSAVGVVLFTAKEEVFRSLFCTTSAVRAVYLVNSMKVGFIVAVANFKLKKTLAISLFVPIGIISFFLAFQANFAA
jgi:hypothetical protein